MATLEERCAKELQEITSDDTMSARQKLRALACAQAIDDVDFTPNLINVGVAFALTIGWMAFDSWDGFVCAPWKTLCISVLVASISCMSSMIAPIIHAEVSCYRRAKRNNAKHGEN